MSLSSICNKSINFSTSSMRLVHPMALPSHAIRARRLTTQIRASIDPLSNRTTYESGFTFTVHSPEQFQEFKGHPDKLTVLMAKSSHCKPCKAFMLTYIELASRFPDYFLLDIIGDENNATKKMMMDLKVKATPTFLLYRKGELVYTVTGTGSGKLLRALLAQLKEGERGKDWIEKTHSTLSSEDSDVENE